MTSSTDWACPYCDKPLPDERAACCGEVGHANRQAPPTTEAGSIEPPECKYCGKAIFSEREACDVCMPVPTGPVALTLQQKLNALGARFYSHLQWTPKAGDYYTSSRADLELYRVVKIEDGTVYTEYCTSPGNLADWPEGDFTTKGFGLQRVWVPDWVLQIKQSPEPAADLLARLDVWFASYMHDRQNHDEAAALLALIRDRRALTKEGGSNG